MENHQLNYYQLSTADTLSRLKTTVGGLKAAEAAQRLSLHGRNKLQVARKEFVGWKFLAQFKDFMVILLVVAGSLSLYLGEYRDAIIMFALVLINATIGFVQEYKAEKVMDSLQNMVQSKAKVWRDGVEIEISSEDLVVGDIISLEEGDCIPADVRILKENSLGTNDFALTGESSPTRKFLHEIKGDVPLGNRNNMAFMGTTVATGNGIGIVVATGMQTEIGRIANLSQQTKFDLSPLQKELNHLTKNITVITLLIGAALFVLGLFLNFSMKEAFLFALGIAAACVPEGMPAQVSIALSLAAGRLAKEKAVVKKLSAVETLGSTHIICTDKTGTLTKNEMTVQKLMIGLKNFTVSGIGYENNGQILDEKGLALSPAQLEEERLFFENGVFASNAKVNPPDKDHATWYAIGDPTEAALVTLGNKAGVNSVELDEKFPEIHEFTFDSVRKRMSSIRKREKGVFAYVKGSPQGILECCTRIYVDGVVREMTDEDRRLIKAKDDENALEALRNLGYAYKELPEYREDMTWESVEKDLIWLGLVSMIDPPREEVKAAMEAALLAHIRVIIITGDYALTASAIAERIGLNAESTDKKITIVNGDELEKMSDIELLHELIHSNLVFSRTSPEEKLRIVGLLKKTGEVVAVTGDGVNDAPALKKADIGVAMGKTGTDVAKNSAEIILLDDSFATLVSAIREGRTIFQNLKKTILSSLTSNSGELFAVLLSLPASLLWGFPISITAIQILAIDLVGEMLPLTFLTWDAAQPRIMHEAPRNAEEHIMNKFSLIDLAWSGLTMGGIGYVNFLLFFSRENASLHIDVSDPLYMRATTLTYISIVMVQWANIMSRRAGGQESVFSPYLWSNKRLLIGYGISLLLILQIVYNPWVGQFMHTAPLSLLDWTYAVGGGLLYLGIRESYKIVRKRKVQSA